MIDNLLNLQTASLVATNKSCWVFITDIVKLEWKQFLRLNILTERKSHPRLLSGCKQACDLSPRLRESTFERVNYWGDGLVIGFWRLRGVYLLEGLTYPWWGCFCFGFTMSIIKVWWLLFAQICCCWVRYSWILQIVSQFLRAV